MKTSEESKSEDTDRAISILKKGGIVIFPTDTVYGIGCVWDNKAAISRIKKIKITTQNFPILINSLTQLNEMAHVTPAAQSLINNYWPGALTIILKGRKGNESIGIRMPNSNLIRNLIIGVGKPIIGTSANFHSKPSPKSFEELDKNLLKLADFSIEGDCDLKRESTVVDASKFPIKILRRGAVELK